MSVVCFQQKSLDGGWEGALRVVGWGKFHPVLFILDFLNSFNFAKPLRLNHLIDVLCSR